MAIGLLKLCGDEGSHYYEHEVLLEQESLLGPHPNYGTTGFEISAAFSKREGLKMS